MKTRTQKKTSLTIQFRPHAFQAISENTDFYPKARELRKHFEWTFSDPLQAKSERFCWDYWNVPNQYRLLRTPAQPFFERANFRGFLEHLLQWSRRNLGCQMISDPWMSAYIDGSFQNLHSDVPHGPFSFVYSLTPWQTRRFSGGETLVTNPTLLRYFSELKSGHSHEEKDFLTRVPARFNQLTVFDPRYPHGVQRVNGVEDLLDARLVIHGWFTDPRPMIEGALTPKRTEKAMDEVANYLLTELGALPYSGLFSLRLLVQADGAINRVEVLASHLVDAQAHAITRETVRRVILPLKEFRFPASRGDSEITLPLLIDFG